MSDSSISSPLRQSRVWLDFGKLVLAAIVQGVVVSAVVALVVMVLASGAVAEPTDVPDGAPSATVASAAPDTPDTAEPR